VQENVKPNNMKTRKTKSTGKRKAGYKGRPQSMKSGGKVKMMGGGKMKSSYKRGGKMSKKK